MIIDRAESLPRAISTTKRFRGRVPTVTLPAWLPGRAFFPPTLCSDRAKLVPPGSRSKLDTHFRPLSTAGTPSWSGGLCTIVEVSNFSYSMEFSWLHRRTFSVPRFPSERSQFELAGRLFGKWFRVLKWTRLYNARFVSICDDSRCLWLVLDVSIVPVEFRRSEFKNDI